MCIPVEELDARVCAKLPRTREIVLYCTCPDEATSAREALRLRRRGFRRVRPLDGGFTAWRARGFAADQRAPVVPPDERVLNAA